MANTFKSIPDFRLSICINYTHRLVFMLTWPDRALVFVKAHHPLWPVDVDDSVALSIHLQKVEEK